MSQAESVFSTAGVTLTRKAERYLADHPKFPGPQHLSRRDHRALAKLRAAAEKEIERLIEFVDRIDGEPDLEDSDEDDDRESEPSLGWAGGWGCSPGTVPNAFFVDCELDDANDEPSLGACERHPSHYGWSSRDGGGSQNGWAQGNVEDLEGEHAGEDDEESDHSGCGDMGGLLEQTTGEPDLGATVDINQVVAWKGLSEALWFAGDGETDLTSTDMEDRYGKAPPTGDIFVDCEAAAPAHRPAWQVPMIGPRLPENSGKARKIVHAMLDAAGIVAANPIHRGRGYSSHW